MIDQINGDQCNVSVEMESNINTTVMMQVSETKTQNHSTEDNYAPLNLVECSMEDLVSIREDKEDRQGENDGENYDSRVSHASIIFDNIKIGDLDLCQLDDLIMQGEQDLQSTPSTNNHRKVIKVDDSTLDIDRKSSSMFNRKIKETFMMQERKSLAIE